MHRVHGSLYRPDRASALNASRLPAGRRRAAVAVVRLPAGGRASVDSRRPRAYRSTAVKETRMSKTIDIEQVRHIGRLSRIELTDEQVERFARQLGDILGYFDKLQELDTDGVEPMAHPIELRNVFAADEPHESLSPGRALANAPERSGDTFLVPKVIGDSQ
jgi:aspartyl-tRNA(Asn)/glutamyl-tRNA(Gln) amidotransferase subunit C